MSRTFTTREKALLIVLAVLVVGCVYYLVVLQPSLSAISSADSQLSSAQDELLVQQTIAANKAQLEQQIAEAEKSGAAHRTLPAYDNTKNEISELNSILAQASSYNIEFSDADTSGSLVRRAVGISFTADSYAAAQAVLDNLINCRYSCLVTDITISGDSLGQSSSTSRVSASAAVTFFERM